MTSFDSDHIPIDEVSSVSKSQTGDEIIDMSWDIYIYLEKKTSIDKFSKLINIYNLITILEDVCKSGYISDSDRNQITGKVKDVKDNLDDEIDLFSISNKFESIIKSLKLSGSKTKALIIIDQIGITFFNEKPTDSLDFNRKIDPIKKLINENSNITKLHQVMHSIKCIDKLFNEDLPKENLPKKEILDLIDQLFKDAS